MHVQGAATMSMDVHKFGMSLLRERFNDGQTTLVLTSVIGVPLLYYCSGRTMRSGMTVGVRKGAILLDCGCATRDTPLNTSFQ